MFLSIFLSSFLTFVELNCENMFDCRHDSLKQDVEFLPESGRHWTPWKYWRKVNNISRAILSCGTLENSDGGGAVDGRSGNFRLPDLIALCEVENDSVMRDITQRSLLRTARYEYIMTDSPDARGIDVALMYSPFSFVPLRHYPLRVEPVDGMRATRDILYVSGRVITDDTLHVFVVHAPSRYGGERYSRPFRMAVAARLCASVDSVRSLSPDAKIIVAGDFNDYAGDKPLEFVIGYGLVDVTSGISGYYGKARGTYCYNGRWGSLDHILVSESLFARGCSSFVNDSPFLLEEDEKYGGFRPFRSYTGYRFSADGTSDHLPLVVRIDNSLIDN